MSRSPRIAEEDEQADEEDGRATPIVRAVRSIGRRRRVAHRTPLLRRPARGRAESWVVTSPEVMRRRLVQRAPAAAAGRRDAGARRAEPLWWSGERHQPPSHRRPDHLDRLRDDGPVPEVRRPRGGRRSRHGLRAQPARRRHRRRRQAAGRGPRADGRLRPRHAHDLRPHHRARLRASPSRRPSTSSSTTSARSCPSRARPRSAATPWPPTAASSRATCRCSSPTCTTGSSTSARSRSCRAAGTPASTSTRRRSRAATARSPTSASRSPSCATTARPSSCPQPGPDSATAKALATPHVIEH